LGGWLADRAGPRVVLTALSLVWGIATILTGASAGLASLVAVRVVLGAGEGGAFPAATRAMAFWMPPTERGFAQGATHAFARLGGAITPPVVLAIALAHGWRASFVVLGAMSLAWTGLWVVVFRDAPAEHPWASEREIAELTALAPPRAGRRAAPTPFRALARAMGLVTFVDFCYGFSLWVFLTWLPSYLKDARGFDLQHMALASSLPLLAGVVGDALGGAASDALLRRTGRLRVARSGVVVLGFVGSVACLGPAVLSGSAAIAVGCLAASFFFLELTNAVLWALPLDIAKGHAGTAGGMMNTGFGVAGMISPVVFGALVQSTGSYRAPFAVTAALLLVGAVAACFVDPARRAAELDSH
ncbi:MAG TPA: MFS transporter, partial [Minicystis sp.]|nr:MFS transporter [Minicystis sp.]